MFSQPHAPDPEASSVRHPTPWALTLGCIGVVYGDIGTSPLYAFREAVKVAGGQAADAAVSQEGVFGILSLIIWALLLLVTCKYVLLLLRADNRGEGGILSLMALAQKAMGKNFGLVFVLGVVGAALFYGDAGITPAISVLSAVEGLGLVTPAFKPSVLFIAIFILMTLFMMQKHGTGKVSGLFGPVMALWFGLLGFLGALHIAQMPGIIAAVNPWYGFTLLIAHPGVALAVLGAVFLAVTGAEALYADLGHFGRKPIRDAWIAIVFPCLLLNYLGQGALLLQNPAAIDNPFFRLAPDWALWPLVLLATTATIIASQAVITGAFSMTQQAIQLGLLPRMEVVHTSASHEGQIYMPKINRYLMYGVLFLCGMFRSSDALASAYGVAVTGTMIVTTCLAFTVIWKIWKKSPALTAAMLTPFFAVEAVFLWANLQKILDGGIVPLCIAAIIVMLILTWVRGSRYLYSQSHRTTVLLSDLMEQLDRQKPKRVPGTAIFLTRDPQTVPAALLQNLKHNRILHAHNFVITVVVTHSPKVDDSHRFIVEHLASTMTRVIILFGYMETPDVPRALRLARKQGLVIDLQEASYFLGRRTIVPASAHYLQEELETAWQKRAAPADKAHGFLHHKKKVQLAPKHGLPPWQDHIYIALAHSAVAATDFFHIPRNQVVELGTQMAV